jgi:hypothetical protein
MKYVALVYYQESIINAMSEKEWHELNQECVAGVERLSAQGHYLAGMLSIASFDLVGRAVHGMSL